MHNGRCLCGAVKYSIDCDIDFIVNCHCRYCRIAHGAEFVPIAIISADKLEIIEGNELMSKFEVPKIGAFRCFCNACGTRLFNHAPEANMISLIVATLTKASDLLPVANVNMESSSCGFEQTNGLPSFSTFPTIDERKELGGQ